MSVWLWTQSAAIQSPANFPVLQGKNREIRLDWGFQSKFPHKSRSNFMVLLMISLHKVTGNFS
jgi:hypothetical protein